MLSEKIFQEFLHGRIVQEAPIHQSHVFGGIKFSQTGFVKVIQGTFLFNYFKIGVLKNCLKKKIHFITIATRVFDGIKLCAQFLKTTSQGTFLPSLVQIGQAVWEEKMSKEIVDDAQSTKHNAQTHMCSGELKIDTLKGPPQLLSSSQSENIVKQELSDICHDDYNKSLSSPTILITLSQTTNFRLFQIEKSLQTTIINLY